MTTPMNTNTPINNLELREALQEKFGKLPYAEYESVLKAAQFVLEWQNVKHAVAPERQFAKLFTVDGNQVLAILTTDEDSPALKVLTRIEGDHLVTGAVSFKMADNEKAWEQATLAFTSFNQENAESFRRNDLQQLGVIPDTKES